MSYHENVEKLRGFNITLWVLVIVGVGVTGLSLLGTVLLSPTASLLGICLAVVYVVGFGALFRFSGLWPKTAPVWWSVACLAWGAGVSFGLVLLSADAWMTLTDNLGWEVVTASFAGAWPEEAAKALGVLLILYATNACTRPWHGFVTGGLIGLGFEVFENILYGGVGAMLDPNSDLEGALTMWALRFVAGPGLHVFLTAVAGFGIGLALFSYRWDKVQRLQALLTGLAWSFTLHFVWNIQWPQWWMQLTGMCIVAILLYGTAIGIWIWSRRAIREDAGVVVVKRPVTRFEDLPGAS
ncbi:PrsW family intramembrane metalloprotease [Corynebacterium pelargi]|uniref:Uncharacterized protein n=1 Tax=Corynebacterium pelargi TaxID=1471400 RepID=A0A410W645_9CORY|nr:PrsW family intramembrane metalloprotease [Corynebacterium pelargi]QAU51420.1 hypothetical protein CPELA_00580 [Corynebacterium pelargi]GGG81076.1 protease PrsW [Corynebacterium pelargi]